MKFSERQELNHRGEFPIRTSACFILNRHRITAWYDSRMAKTLTAIRLEPKQLTELEKIAKREDRAVSYLIRKSIDEYIKSEKR